MEHRKETGGNLWAKKNTGRLKLGKKDYQMRLLRGAKPILQVLDDILPDRSSYSEAPIGLMQIPIDQIAGTKTFARSSSFAGNFMPILREDTEFAVKWGICWIPMWKRESVNLLRLMNICINFMWWRAIKESV